MGGMILEKTVGPAMVGEVLAVTGTGEPVSMGYDLVISANPSTEALYTKRLVDGLKRTEVGLVLEDDEGRRRAAHGPMMVSITSERDGVTRFMVPIAMTVNSVFLRFRGDAGDGLPSQRTLGIKTAGHTPALFSHEVVVRGDEIVISELPGRWNDTPLWVFQVPVEISADHGDLSSPLMGQLMKRLLDLNEVFDPELELKLATVR
jgi:hypothetical protein